MKRKNIVKVKKVPKVKRVKKVKKLTITEKRHKQKACYGSKEWSINAAICKRCKWQKPCGKVKHKLPGPDFKTIRGTIIRYT